MKTTCDVDYGDIFIIDYIDNNGYDLDDSNSARYGNMNVCILCVFIRLETFLRWFVFCTLVVCVWICSMFYIFLSNFFNVLHIEIYKDFLCKFNVLLHVDDNDDDWCNLITDAISLNNSNPWIMILNQSTIIILVIIINFW